MRAVYDSFFASNHIDLLTSYLNLYSNVLSLINADTLTYYGIDGAKVPETMKWNGIGNNLGGDYTEKVFTAGPDITMKMYMKYKYTNNLTYLRNTTYPFMKEIVKFYQSSLSFNGTHYEMVSSNARENYWNVKNALPDLAAVKALFPMAIEASTLLNMDFTASYRVAKYSRQYCPLSYSSLCGRNEIFAVRKHRRSQP
jgi:alpha-L-fucosidase 2